MTNDEKITLDIERAGEFLRHLIDNPSEMKKIPSGSHIRFVDNFENLDAPGYPRTEIREIKNGVIIKEIIHERPEKTCKLTSSAIP